jgi:hypothetical protein
MRDTDQFRCKHHLELFHAAVPGLAGRGSCYLDIVCFFSCGVICHVARPDASNLLAHIIYLLHLSTNPSHLVSGIDRFDRRNRMKCNSPQMRRVSSFDFALYGHP